MSSKIKATSLLTALCLGAALTMTACGSKDKETATTETTTTTTTTAPAATTAPATGSTTTDTTAPATGAAGGKLNAADKAKLTPVKTALTMANSAIKSGKIDAAKTQFDKFSAAWPMVEPIVKAKAGDKYPAIEKGIAMVKTAMSAAKPDQAKAGEGLTAAIAGFNELMK